MHLTKILVVICMHAYNYENFGKMHEKGHTDGNTSRSRNIHQNSGIFARFFVNRAVFCL
jgi:hypothetical protein